MLATLRAGRRQTGHSLPLWTTGRQWKFSPASRGRTKHYRYLTIDIYTIYIYKIYIYKYRYLHIINVYTIDIYTLQISTHYRYLQNIGIFTLQISTLRCGNRQPAFPHTSHPPTIVSIRPVHPAHTPYYLYILFTNCRGEVDCGQCRIFSNLTPTPTLTRIGGI